MLLTLTHILSIACISHAEEGPNIDQGLSGGLGPLLARAANGLLAGFRNAKEQGVFSQFGEELRNIFAIDEPDSELEDNDFDEQAYQQQLLQAKMEKEHVNAGDRVLPKHAIKDVNYDAPTDLSALTNDEKIIVYVNEAMEEGDVPEASMLGHGLDNLISKSFQVFMGMLNAQRGVAEAQRGRNAPKRQLGILTGGSLLSGGGGSLLSGLLSSPVLTGPRLLGNFFPKGQQGPGQPQGPGQAPGQGQAQGQGQDQGQVQNQQHTEEQRSLAGLPGTASLPFLDFPEEGVSAQGVSEGPSDDSWVIDSQIQGENLVVLRAGDSMICAKMCSKNPRCEFFTMMQSENLCYQFTSADSLSPKQGAISGPKPKGETVFMGGGAPPPSPSLRGAETSTDQGAGEGLLGGEGLLSGQGLGSLIGSGGSGLLSALTGQAGGAMNALNAASAVMTSGSQIMSALPLKELSAAAMQLAESGYFRNRGIQRGLVGKGRDKSSLPPPPGIGSPSVHCRSAGMTCCIPRQAVQDWRNKPPYLNQYKQTECQSVYVSTSDEMCATASYDESTDLGRCGVIVTETADFKVHRHVLTVPSKTVNNAICECIKSPEDLTARGSARWEYSIVAAEELKMKQEETEQTAQRFVKGANAAVALSQVLSGSAVDSTRALASAGGGQGSGSLNSAKGAGNALNAITQAVGLAGSLGSMLGSRKG